MSRCADGEGYSLLRGQEGVHVAPCGSPEGASGCRALRLESGWVRAELHLRTWQVGGVTVCSAGWRAERPQKPGVHALMWQWLWAVARCAVSTREVSASQKRAWLPRQSGCGPFLRPCLEITEVFIQNKQFHVNRFSEEYNSQCQSYFIMAWT